MIQNTKLIYIIGAYSGKIKENINAAREASIKLIRLGYHTITPHLNTAGFEKYEGECINWQTWITMDLNILSRCDMVFILPSAKTSKGSQIEIAFAKEHNIPELIL